jgi:hypothetical protein
MVNSLHFLYIEYPAGVQIMFEPFTAEDILQAVRRCWRKRVL